MARPNIVLIVTDNQSPWTLGCYGNREIRTPHIDRLAGDGIRFEHTFCVNPVCSPNRATLLTGLIPSQHGVHSYLGGEQPDAQMGPDAYCTIEEFPNLPQTLCEAGYECGLSGKWHLGDSLHPQLGFTSWLTKPDGHTSAFRDVPLIRDGEVYQESRYTTEVITEHAASFLRQPRSSPFFLYVGYNGPYGLDQETLTGHQNRHTAGYADEDLTCFPRETTHPWLKQYRDRMDNPVARRSYAAAVSGVDDGVGALMDTLDELNLAEDTLVIFTADHGLCGGHHGMWGMGDHSRPLHLFQENLQIPMIFRCPDSFPGGFAWDGLNANYDLFPTLLDLLDLDLPVTVDPPYAGRSHLGVLKGTGPDTRHTHVFHEYHNVRSVQTKSRKLNLRHPNGPDEFYDLEQDPGESLNLIEDPRVASEIAELKRTLEDFFASHTDPRFDLWNSGQSKAGALPDLS